MFLLCAICACLSLMKPAVAADLPETVFAKISYYIVDKKDVCISDTCIKKGFEKVTAKVSSAKKGFIYLGLEEDISLSEAPHMKEFINKIGDLHKYYMQNQIPSFSSKYLVVKYEFNKKLLSQPTLTVTRFPADKDDWKKSYTYSYPDGREYKHTVYSYETALYFYPLYRKYWTVRIRDDDPANQIDKTYTLNAYAWCSKR